MLLTQHIDLATEIRDTSRTRSSQKTKGLVGANRLTPVIYGSSTWARTRDLRINSPYFWNFIGFQEFYKYTYNQQLRSFYCPSRSHAIPLNPTTNGNSTATRIEKRELRTTRQKRHSRVIKPPSAMTSKTPIRVESVKTARVAMVTAREIEAASNKAKVEGKDVWLTDPAARGQGRFMVRCTAAGARVCMYRQTLADGTRDTLKVADYDPRGVSGMTLHEAREKAGEFARYAAGGNSLRAKFAEHEQAKVEAQALAVEAQRRAQRGSLDSLMNVYVSTLMGRQSHDDAQSIFRLHVSEPFPELVKRGAASVKAEQLRDVLARLIDAGKGRTAAKLRAYLRAAYGLAMRASLDPTIPAALTAFDVESNPADRLPSLAQFSKALDRALTLPELHSFWRRVVAAPNTAARDALIACLLLGGQRPTQLLRATPRDVDHTAGRPASRQNNCGTFWRG